MYFMCVRPPLDLKCAEHLANNFQYARITEEGLLLQSLFD